MKDDQKKAVALGYSKEDEAPKVLAKGQGLVAEKIIESAKENKIPLIKDPETVTSLTSIEMGQAIPPELYQVVANIYTFLIDRDREMERIIHEK